MAHQRRNVRRRAEASAVKIRGQASFMRAPCAASGVDASFLPLQNSELRPDKCRCDVVVIEQRIRPAC